MDESKKAMNIQNAFQKHCGDYTYDDDAAKDSITALEALMEIKRSSVDLSDTSTRIKGNIQTTQWRDELSRPNHHRLHKNSLVSTNSNHVATVPKAPLNPNPAITASLYATTLPTPSSSSLLNSSMLPILPLPFVTQTNPAVIETAHKNKKSRQRVKTPTKVTTSKECLQSNLQPTGGSPYNLHHKSPASQDKVTPVKHKRRQPEQLQPQPKQDHPPQHQHLLAQHDSNDALPTRPRPLITSPILSAASTHFHPPQLVIKDTIHPNIVPFTARVSDTIPIASKNPLPIKQPSEEMVTVARDDDEKTESELVVIRVDKIEAALKSEPQRGRKRENLNAYERLELTRTRNREHAKSTRIRKKARYDELIEREAEYFQQKHIQERDDVRRKNLIRFMELRTEYFLTATHLDHKKSSWDFTLDAASNEKCTVSEEACPDSSDVSNQHRQLFENSSFKSGLAGRIISSNDLPANNNLTCNESSSTTSASIAFTDVVDDLEAFKFALSCGENMVSVGIASLNRYDLQIHTRFRATIPSNLIPNSSSYPLLSYRINGGSQGIGINQQGNAFAEFQLVSCTSLPECEKQNNVLKTMVKSDSVLMSGMFQVEFSNSTNKIMAIKIFSITESHPSLSDHNIFPSVVSLDQQPSHCSKGDVGIAVGSDGNDLNYEPGMNI